MDNKKSTPTPTPPPTPFYEDFDPNFEWSREEASDTLRVHLPGFKRDNLHVEVDDYGNLMTSGERALDSTRRIRFRKAFQIPENCNVDDIHAKFESAVLYVIHPKVKTADRLQDRLPAAVATEPPPRPTSEPLQEPKPEPPAAEPKRDMDKKAGLTAVETEPPGEPKPKPPAAEPERDEDKKAGETVLDETAKKQAEENQEDAGKINVEKETDGTKGPAGNEKVVGDAKAGDEATDDKVIKPIDEGRIEPKPEHEISDGEVPMLELTKPMQPLLNVAGAILVLMCLAMYAAYKLGKAT